MDWIKKEDRLPEKGIRVVVYTPEQGENEPMEFRIVDGQFVKYCTHATHWAHLEAPEESS